MYNTVLYMTELPTKYSTVVCTLHSVNNTVQCKIYMAVIPIEYCTVVCPMHSVYNTWQLFPLSKYIIVLYNAIRVYNTWQYLQLNIEVCTMHSAYKTWQLFPEYISVCTLHNALVCTIHDCYSISIFQFVHCTMHWCVQYMIVIPSVYFSLYIATHYSHYITSTRKEELSPRSWNNSYRILYTVGWSDFFDRTEDGI